MVTLNEARRIMLATIEDCEGVEASEIASIAEMLERVLERCGVEVVDNAS